MSASTIITPTSSQICSPSPVAGPVPAGAPAAGRVEAAPETCRFPGGDRPAAGRRGSAPSTYCTDASHNARAASGIKSPGHRGQNALAASVFASLARSGKWEQWQELDSRLALFGSLEEARAAWRCRDQRCYLVVSALTALGSRRGGDDDDAALATVVMLGEGVSRVAGTLRDVCEVDDVLAMVWEEVKAAEPHLTHAGRYLLARAHQRLCRPSAGMVPRFETTSLEARIAMSLGQTDHDDDRADPDRNLAIAAPTVEDPVEDLIDLLSWARNVGVIATDEIELLVELIATEHEVLARGETKRAREEAQRIVGARRGVTMRQIRRRRDQTAARLRDAAPQYLAATA